MLKECEDVLEKLILYSLQKDKIVSLGKIYILNARDKIMIIRRIFKDKVIRSIYNIFSYTKESFDKKIRKISSLLKNTNNSVSIRKNCFN